MNLKNTNNSLELSIVVPVYNSSKTLHELKERLENVLFRIVGSSYQLIFVNDGSVDDSWEILEKMALENGNITAVNLTRNFGQHNALMCGFSMAKGKYLLTMDDDLQNPPEEISKLFSEIKKNYDVVYGIADTKRHAKYRNWGSELIQFVYRKTFNINIRISSFRIIQIDIARRMLSYKKSFTFIDGIISLYTSKIGNVMVTHHERKKGRSGYSFGRLVVLSLNLMTNFSIVPVQLASLSGFVFAIAGFSIGLYMLIKKIFWGIPVSGFASTIIAITMFSGIQLLTIGVLGEYISRVHINLSGRPQYAIRDVVGEREDGELKSANNS